jgi:3-methyladenine DNA glycosylase AlkD
MRNKPIDCMFSICGNLLEQRSWPMGIIAYDFAYRMRKQYCEGPFTIFEHWLDEHDLFRKGYGWMLKVLSTKEPDIVFDYLAKNKAVMPRVSYRYALEKMDAEKRRLLT